MSFSMSSDGVSTTPRVPSRQVANLDMAVSTVSTVSTVSQASGTGSETKATLGARIDPALALMVIGSVTHGDGTA
ncbi:hypothetical protein [Paraliomyxa miuraensis]|uniref:hypothetical protein n=1 Tax=Paraliomyxa miuraensis TaxID=376150 RepID=UPI002252CA07|nr:hypothetical protein [Paraliomyxa miuraensis]MCX4239180.1 hypothetical protein [Paraliomyxa miuraensis]